MVDAKVELMVLMKDMLMVETMAAMMVGTTAE